MLQGLGEENMREDDADDCSDGEHACGDEDGDSSGEEEGWKDALAEPCEAAVAETEDLPREELVAFPAPVVVSTPASFQVEKSVGVIRALGEVQDALRKCGQMGLAQQVPGKGNCGRAAGGEGEGG